MCSYYIAQMATQHGLSIFVFLKKKINTIPYLCGTL